MCGVPKGAVHTNRRRDGLLGAHHAFPNAGYSIPNTITDGSANSCANTITHDVTHSCAYTNNDTIRINRDAHYCTNASSNICTNPKPNAVATLQVWYILCKYNLCLMSSRAMG